MTNPWKRIRGRKNFAWEQFFGCSVALSKYCLLNRLRTGQLIILTWHIVLEGGEKFIWSLLLCQSLKQRQWIFFFSLTLFVFLL